MGKNKSITTDQYQAIKIFTSQDISGQTAISGRKRGRVVHEAIVGIINPFLCNSFAVSFRESEILLRSVVFLYHDVVP